MSQQAGTGVLRTAGRWTEADVPDQSGRTAVITGGNSGIGFEAARVLAGRGARLLLACRDLGKAHDAVIRIRATAPGADVRVVLLDRLAAPGSRVVTVSSNNHRDGRINFDDLQSEHGYRRMAGYAQSKLANLMFSYELQRRLAAAGHPAIAVAAHPGLTRTDLARYLSRVMTALYVLIERPLAQSAAMGALGTLRAATDPGVRGGEYYGPVRWRGERGWPARIGSSEGSHDRSAQRRLWQESERLTGVRYPL